VNDSLFYAHARGVLSDRGLSPAKYNELVCSLIEVLFFLRCPPAVLFAIVTVVIFAIQAVGFAWSLSHVSVKRIE